MKKKTIFNGYEYKEYIINVGKISTMSKPDMDDYSGYADIVTEDGKFEIRGKPAFVILCGQVLMATEDYTDNFSCSDPRVICMYLWNLRRHFYGLPDEVPPVPTRKEARKWLKDADIPLEPREFSNDDDYSPKTEKFLFNNKL